MSICENFEYGQVRVKPSSFGEWEISNFNITEEDAKFFNMRNVFNNRQHLNVKAGSYTKLIKNGDVVMSNTQMELDTNAIAYSEAQGTILIAGLGMGMILDAILSKPDVNFVRVIELDQSIINNIGVLYKDDPRVEIIQGDILEYKPSESEKYDYIWFDIWTFICEDNCDDFLNLYNTFKNNCEYMSFWGLEYFSEEYFEGCEQVLL